MTQLVNNPHTARSKAVSQDLRSIETRDKRVSTQLVSKAWFGLLAFDLFGFGHNFAAMHRFVRAYQVSPEVPSSPTIECICEAVNYACVFYPKRARCLQRSAVTTCLLRKCGIPAEMVMGAQHFPFQAHAWTEVNGKAINEGRDVQESYEIWERC